MADDVKDEGRRKLPVIDGPVRADLDDGLRFAHAMGMQTKHDLFDTATKLGALVETLVAAGHIDPLALEERKNRIRQREAPRQAEKAHIQVAAIDDKYALTGLPDIPCAELVPLCEARCCRLNFQLSFQDLDEALIEWDYALPYVVRKQEDGYCVHSDAGTRQCTVHDKRPGSCRLYDCRTDKRIWLDYEKRIPAP